MPDAVDGVQQTPLPGVSMRYSFDDAATPTHKEVQYYEMCGTRALWERGWKAGAEHGPLPFGMGNFEGDRWQLFHTDVDRVEAHDLAEQHPERVEALEARWLEEAEKYNVLPLNDLSILELRALEFEIPVPPTGRYTYYPGTSEIPEQSAAKTSGTSFKILAEVELTPQSQGVIVSQGSRFGGYSLFVKDGQLHYAYNFLGIPPEQLVSGAAPTEGRHVVGVEFTKREMGEYHEWHGTLKLHVDDAVIAEGEIRTIGSRYSLCGEGLCVGRDGGDPVSSAYGYGFPFTGGWIEKVVFDVADDAYVNVERELAAAFAGD